LKLDTQGSRGGNPGLEVVTASRYLIRASFSLSLLSNAVFFRGSDKLKFVGHFHNLLLRQRRLREFAIHVQRSQERQQVVALLLC